MSTVRVTQWQSAILTRRTESCQSRFSPLYTQDVGWCTLSGSYQPWQNSIYHLAWVSVFESTFKQLLTWHVDSMLRGRRMQAVVYSWFKVLLEKLDVDMFTTLIGKVHCTLTYVAPLCHIQQMCM